MGRQLQVDWKEDEDTLKALYLAEKDHQRRTRLQALWYLRQGHTIEETAARVGKHARTIQTWVAWYRAGGRQEVLDRRQGGQGGTPRRLSPEQEEELETKARQGEIRTIWDGVHWAQEQGVEYTYWGMRWVFWRLKLKKKVPRPSNPQASPQEQEEWKKGGLLCS